MARCQQCKHLDKEKSNKNWIVCPDIPLSVIKANTSKDCENFSDIESVSVQRQDHRPNDNE
jgi:hypothetical protein